jgi:hypothetical protein
MSNSKLTKEQKIQLKAFKRNNPDIVFVSVEYVTVCLRKTGENTAMFANALASLDEKKFRVKVGQYYAMQRFINGPMPIVIRSNATLQHIKDMAYHTALALNQG